MDPKPKAGLNFRNRGDGHEVYLDGQWVFVREVIDQRDALRAEVEALREVARAAEEMVEAPLLEGWHIEKIRALLAALAGEGEG